MDPVSTAITSAAIGGIAGKFVEKLGILVKSGLLNILEIMVKKRR